MTLYHKNKTLCIITPFENEPTEHFIDRCNFIASQNINDDIQYNKTITYSRLYTNTKYLNTKYDNQTTQNLNKLITNTHT
jgi:hypothetical protein